MNLYAISNVRICQGPILNRSLPPVNSASPRLTPKRSVSAALPQGRWMTTSASVGRPSTSNAQLQRAARLAAKCGHQDVARADFQETRGLGQFALLGVLMWLRRGRVKPAAARNRSALP